MTTEQIEEFNDTFASISTEHPAPKVRRATIAQYAKIAAPIDIQEAASRLDCFRQSKIPDLDSMKRQSCTGPELLPALRWIQLTKSKAAEIQAEIQARVRAYGALQGIVHSVFLGSRPPFFNLREKSTGALVKCIYSPAVYPELAAALQRMNAIIHVFSYTSTDLVDRKIEDMEVSQILLAPVLRESEFERLFGSDRQFTGGLTTQEFINNVRDRGRQSPKIYETSCFVEMAKHAIGTQSICVSLIYGI